jgi:ABC-type multidrug transport system ATPase subunit
LIEDLGLSQVKHTRVKDLTFSERQRLNVACHLLLDTDIVVLDQVQQNIKKIGIGPK